MDKGAFRPYNCGMSRSHYTKYLTYSKDDTKWQIYCTDAGSNSIGPGVVYPPHKEHHPKQFKSVTTGRILNEYQIIYISEGSGTFTSGDNTFEVVPGSVLLLFPNILHTYKPNIEVGWTEFWVGFQGNYADTLVQEEILTPSKPFYRIGYHTSLLSLFAAIFEEVNKQEPLYQFRVGAKIMSLLAEVFSFGKKDIQHSKSQEIVERAKHIFNEHIYEHLDLDEVAGEIGISKSHLCEVFRLYTDMTPYQYFIHAKINKAKELLETENLSIKEISFKLGFRDQYYFSRLFRNKTGIPPSKWVITFSE